MNTSQSRLGAILARHEDAILTAWVKDQNVLVSARGVSTQAQLKRESRAVFTALKDALERAADNDASGPEWVDVKRMLAELSSSRARQGYSPSESAMFIFSLKQALFALLREEYVNEPLNLAEATWTASMVLDRLGLYTVETFQITREEVITRQQQELLELSTPVVQLWDEIVALPLIGTLDSARTQVVMESLLEKIVETRSSIAIIDITGVPTVDTLVAQHLLKTVAAARLMGTDCIISGIRPQIAQTIVHLGVDLSGVTTKATLADAFRVALKRTGSALGAVPDKA